MASKETKLQNTVMPVLMTLVMMSVLLSLGFWQLERLKWKEEIIAALSVKAPAERAVGNSMQYSRVRVTGRYLYDKSVFIGPRTNDGVNGFHVITPLMTPEFTVLVNRGFSEKAHENALENPPGELTVEGTVVYPEKGMFTPDNGSPNKVWYWADIPAIAGKKFLNNPLPYLVYTDDIKPEVSNNHLQYAIFWFTMAFVLAIVFVLYQWKPTKK